MKKPKGGSETVSNNRNKKTSKVRAKFLKELIKENGRVIQEEKEESLRSTEIK